MKCYACGNEAVVLFEYTSTLSKNCREARCEVCADALRESDHTIHKETVLKEDFTDANQDKRPTPQTSRRPRPPHMLTGGSTR